MDFDLTEEHLAIVDAVSKVCSEFDDEYWSEKDRDDAESGESL